MDHVIEETANWTMPAASGRTWIRCAVVSYSPEIGALVVGFETSGEFWPRGSSDRSGSTVTDFQVALPQVVLGLASLKSLRERLVEWQVNPSSFALELGVGRKGDQRITCAIGRDENLIYSVDKPAFTMTYGCGSAMQGRWSFVVDQSCIWLCAEGIGEFVRIVEAAPT